KAAYLLPCLGRTEIDERANVRQEVSTEDSTACVHGTLGRKAPADERLMSEPAIVANLAKPIHRASASGVPWDAWKDDYSQVRDAIENTYPERFAGFNKRMWEPGGFPLTNPPRERIWNTDTGKAKFTVPESLSALHPEGVEDDTVLQLT